jgi:hypothetical protein
VDSSLGGVLSPIKDAITGGGGATSTASSGMGSGIIWGVGLFVGIAVIAVIGALVWYFWYERKQWTIVTRVHYENPTINGVSIGSPVKTKRVRFKDGRVVYLYKSPIQGYTISPELLVWTRPKEHDVIVTQDKKLFCLVGIENIDVKRKKLNVDISHPDIEMDRQDLQQHIDSKKYDDPNERFKIIAKVALWIFVMITVIVVAILGGKAYIEGKNVDLERDKVNLQVSQSQVTVMEDVATFTVVLKEMLPELQQLKGRQIIFQNNTGV